MLCCRLRYVLCYATDYGNPSASSEEVSGKERALWMAVEFFQTILHLFQSIAFLSMASIPFDMLSLSISVLNQGKSRDFLWLSLNPKARNRYEKANRNPVSSEEFLKKRIIISVLASNSASIWAWTKGLGPELTEKVGL